MFQWRFAVSQLQWWKATPLVQTVLRSGRNRSRFQVPAKAFPNAWQSNCCRSVASLHKIGPIGTGPPSDGLAPTSAGHHPGWHPPTEVRRIHVYSTAAMRRGRQPFRLRGASLQPTDLPLRSSEATATADLNCPVKDRLAGRLTGGPPPDRRGSQKGKHLGSSGMCG